jgi:four helix bundle protein
MGGTAEGRKGERTRGVRDLRVYQNAFEAAMMIFELSKTFPVEERYSLTDQMRRSSRSVSANLAEAWRKRRYRAAFLAKLNDAEAEASETTVWIEFAFASPYISEERYQDLLDRYDHILAQLVLMVDKPNPWLIPSNQTPSR